jgi:hypothetical protein
MGVEDKLLAQSDSIDLDFGDGAAFQVNMNDMGKVDSLRFSVLSCVVEEKYALAAEAIKHYVEQRRDYPLYLPRTERLMRHCIDLIYAIRTKRSLPGLGNLSASRQQEIFARAREHFEELKYTIKRMEKVEADLRRADLRSTIWVLNSLTISVFSIVLVGFALEVTGGLLSSMVIVIGDGVDRILSLISL